MDWARPTTITEWGATRKSRRGAAIRWTRVCIALAFGVISCRGSQDVKDERAPGRGDESGAAEKAQGAPPSTAPEPPWERRCAEMVSWKDSWEPHQLAAAQAVATLALDGAVAVPEIEPPEYAPATQFHSTWDVAVASHRLGRDAASLFDRALADARAMKDYQGQRSRTFLFAALALEELGMPARVEPFVRAIEDDDVRHELAANRVRFAVEAGDIDRALEGLRALPPTWSMYSELAEHRPWLGSAAAAACVALSSLEVAKSPRASALVEAAAAISEGIDGWRRNGAWRALALLC